MLRLSLGGALLVFAGLMLGCGASPADLCKKYDQIRAKDGFTNGADVVKACETELGEYKKTLASSYERLDVCLRNNDTVKAVHECIPSSITGYGKDGTPEAEVHKRWRYGIAAAATGAWAAKDQTGDLTAQMCADGALNITVKKITLNVLDSLEKDSHMAEMKKMCLEALKKPAYAKKFRCMRRVPEDKAKFMQCVGYGTYDE